MTVAFLDKSTFSMLKNRFDCRSIGCSSRVSVILPLLPDLSSGPLVLKGMVLVGIGSVADLAPRHLSRMASVKPAVIVISILVEIVRCFCTLVPRVLFSATQNFL